jgi:hypothetical protein
MALKQSRRMSLLESLVNVLVGYGVAVITQMLVFPLFGLVASVSQNLSLGLVFTVISLIRSYLLRRVFEALRVGHMTGGDHAPARRV